MDAVPSPRALRQIRRDLLISFLAVLSVGIGLYEFLRPRAAVGLTPLDVVDLGIVAIFIVDFVTHARRSGDWRRYVRRHWWEIPSLVPVTGAFVAGLEGYAVVRGVRLARLVRVARLFRVAGVAPRTRRGLRYVGRIAARAQVTKIAVSGALSVAAGAVALYVAEAGNPGMRSAGDAAWWSFSMFTTVAYAVPAPQTAAGRAVAGAIALAGLAFFGVFTASLAGAILKEPGEEPAEPPPEEPLD